MLAILPGLPVIATPSRALLERPGHDRLLEDVPGTTYMALQLQLQRVQRPAR